MSDDIDRIQDADEIQLTAALSHISGVIPKGVRGVCDECGEDMPRLVGGLCGYCRDGRRPALDRYQAPARSAPVLPRRDDTVIVEAATAPAPGVSLPAKEDTVPNPPGSKTVGFTARGDVLAAINALVANGSSVSAAVQSLVEAGLNRPAERQVEAAERLLIHLAEVPLDDLLAELRERVGRSEAGGDLLSRATSAEARLAELQSQISNISGMLSQAIGGESS